MKVLCARVPDKCCVLGWFINTVQQCIKRCIELRFFDFHRGERLR